MTLDEFFAFIGAISYKPGWRLEARRHAVLPYLGEREERWGAEVKVTALVQDASQTAAQRRASVRTIDVAQSMVVEPELIADLDEARAMDIIRTFLMDAEQHECDEWLALRGKKPFDPHSEEDRAAYSYAMAGRPR